MSVESYIKLRHKAAKLDVSAWNPHDGSFNPLIPEIMSFYLSYSHLSQMTVWEPFAGHGGNCHSADIFFKHNIRHIAYDISATDERVKKIDSTLHGPGELISGFLFHPPYFGAANMSNESGEISLLSDIELYLSAIRKTICFGMTSLIKNGLIFSISRRYYNKGKLIPLDEMFLIEFFRFDCVLEEVMLSVPDIVKVFRKV